MSDASGDQIGILARVNLHNTYTFYPTTYKVVVGVETSVRFQAFTRVDTWRLDEVVEYVGIFNIRPQLPVN